ncbi:RNA polymerase beta subunit [Tanacetum coccineum]
MPRSLSLRTPAHFQLGSLLARLALAQNSQLTLPTQRREVVYLLSLNMPTAFRSLTQDSLVYLLASAIPHLSFQGSPRSGSERTLIHESGLEELEGIGFNPATGSPYGYLVVNERPDLYSSSNLLLMIKKKEEKELGSFEKTGKSRIFDGRTGDPFEQPVIIGKPYILKLIHQVDDKIHGRSSGRYSRLTQQPLKGRAKKGGQRVEGTTGRRNGELARKYLVLPTNSGSLPAWPN